MIAAQLAFTYLPVMNALFHSTGIGAVSWVLITAVGLSIYLIIGLAKWLQNREARTKVERVKFPCASQTAINTKSA